MPLATKVSQTSPGLPLATKVSRRSQRMPLITKVLQTFAEDAAYHKGAKDAAR
ncbi:hypothetical protein DPMN_137393 [Dreissena polymorpha]|uniref:Uncharacterized protein n=1 Tax=Dreissena polymorpha TaxID=45954 RepID=A0A9D4JEN6_DREPO|nr:hypothetical protein DPMN_137393 [Dreissena polymorpha]